ncbi:hypothetical protein G3O08_18935 [Cryomorpha ignava]|uniref:Uncharacterized protein n=1 Tax=Cryomorpha ignava TaxID=101383 RepID=A0A7K3WXJ1_9FLAO|nr:hypothetical protein [Cryomorpha ignava]NEN25572.1 hypothetical protein [Cryomorpha ignava]
MKKLKLKSLSKKIDLYDDGFDNESIQREKKRLKPIKRIRKQDIDRFDDEY